MYKAKLVYFDPDIDLAVLEVPDLPGRPAELRSDADRGESAAVLGYPENGGLQADSRTRAEPGHRTGTRHLRRGHRAFAKCFRCEQTCVPETPVDPWSTETAKSSVLSLRRPSTDDDTGYAMTSRQVAGVLSMWGFGSTRRRFRRLHLTPEAGASCGWSAVRFWVFQPVRPARQ